MKRFLVLLLVLVAGVVAAALAVPSNAATVNGSAISQDSLNSEVHAIAASVPYQCYLNSQAYLTSNGTSGLPPVVGAGTGRARATIPPPPRALWRRTSIRPSTTNSSFRRPTSVA